MPFGAHESMEVHECLLEKIHVMNHFNLYAQETDNPQLLDMLARHQLEEIRSYNEIVEYTHGNNNEFQPVSPNTNIRGVNAEQIQYGVQNPPQFTPQSGGRLSDRDIAIGMLQAHKHGALNCTRSTLECADPVLRRLLLNSAVSCINQAYEVFLYMNGQGLYQVPTLDRQTAETFLHSYQPAKRSLEQQYARMAGQNGAYNDASAPHAGINRPTNISESGITMDGNTYSAGRQHAMHENR